MPGKPVSYLLALSVSLVFFAGCCATPERQSLYPPSPAPCNSCGTNGPLPPRFTPTPPNTPPSNYYTPPTYTPPTYTPPSYTPPSNQSNYVPPTVRLAPPEAVTQDQPRSDPTRDIAKVTPPQTVEPPPASIPNGSSPLVKNDVQPSPRLSVDIPQFALVKPRVAVGQQPFPDGVTWLQNEGYRTVLHIRSPSETDTAAQRVFEQRKLRYLSLEVGPRNLTKEAVDRFNKLVTDEASQPLFVFDRDGSLAGAMWYLHFRTVGGMTDDKAEAETVRLGFRKDQDDNARAMWSAAQAYLRNTNP